MIPQSNYIVLHDGSRKLVSELQPGVDQLATDNGPANLRCLLGQQLTGEYHSMASASENGVVLSNWHPVEVNGYWRFPLEVWYTYVPVTEDENTKLGYDLLLEAGKTHFYTASSNSPGSATVKCLALGHGLVDDSSGSLCSHPYFGGQCRDDLEQIMSQTGYTRLHFQAESWIKTNQVATALDISKFIGELI